MTALADRPTGSALPGRTPQSYRACRRCCARITDISDNATGETVAWPCGHVAGTLMRCSCPDWSGAGGCAHVRAPSPPIDRMATA